MSSLDHELGQEETGIRARQSRFNGEDFFLHRRRIAFALYEKNLDEVVGIQPSSLLMTELPPSIGEGLGDDLKALRADRKAQKIIIDHIDDTVLKILQHANSAYQCWKFLHDTYMLLHYRL
jgi:hypothetical protein